MLKALLFAGQENAAVNRTVLSAAGLFGALAKGGFRTFLAGAPVI
jgi:hypothetical protein